MYGNAEQEFQAIVDRFTGVSEISRGRMFGATGLKTNGKVFAMLVKDRLVIKLPKERVVALVASHRGTYFDPGHGRPMKQWISVPFDAAKDDWATLVDEAKTFVATG